MIRVLPLRLAGLLASFVLAFATPLLAQTAILDDGFADGNRTGQTPPASIDWFLTTGGTVATSSGGIQISSTSNRLLIGYFAAAGAPVGVPLGASIVLEFTFQSDVAPVSSTNGFNLALLNSGGTRVAADFSGTSNAAFAAYDGYGVRTSGLGNTSGSSLQLRQRNAGTSTALMSTSGDWANFATGTGTTLAAAAGVSYVARLEILNNGSTATVSYTLKTADGATTLQSVAGTDTGSVLTAFDTVALYVQNGQFPSGSFTVQRVAVTTSGGGGGGPVEIAPAFGTHPVSQTVTAGANVTFSGAASGTPAPTYQWHKDGNPLAGATGGTLTLTNVQAADAGSYTLVATNSAGTATSNAATLTVNPPVNVAPTILTQPSDQVVMAGGTAVFTVAASGTPAPAYQWRKDGHPLAGATSASLTISNVQLTDTGVYAVEVSNEAGTVLSDPAVLILSGSLPASAFNVAGFGRLATGGGVRPDTDPAYRKVHNAAEFRAAISSSATKVIEIMNDLDLGWNEIPASERTGRFRANATALLHPVLKATGVSLIDIQDFNGLTIFSAHGARIRHAELNVKRCTNLIIRNLRFDELWEWDESTKGDYDRNDWDYITVDSGSTNVWIDHCDFGKAYDGVLDIKGGSNNITISWCRFLEDDGGPGSFVRQQIEDLELNRSAHSMYNFLRTNGFSVDDIVAMTRSQKKGHLVGATEFASENAALSVTLHHTLYVGMQDRLPRLRGGNSHVYNIYVDNRNAYAAKQLRAARIAAMSPTEAAKLGNGTFKFDITQNGAISTEGGAVLVENSYFDGVATALRNNQANVSNPAYTGKIRAVDMIYKFGAIDFRGGSDDPGHPLGPVQAPVIPFSFSGGLTALPYAYVMDDPAALPDILAMGAGAGKIGWDKVNWLKTVYVETLPSIIQPPADQTVFLGETATFAVGVTSASVPSYQWLKDGAPLSGATASTLTIASAQPGDAGAYAVVVTNTAGTVTSTAATLSVSTTPLPPAIVTPPASRTVNTGENTSFTVVATGTALNYAWRKDGAPIAGANGPTLDLEQVTLDDAGVYTVVVSNSVDSVTSAPATLVVTHVIVAPAIVTPPASQIAAIGGNVVLSVTATGTAPLSYQWFKNGVALPGETSATLALGPLAESDAGAYAVEVSNAAGAALSAAAELSVVPAGAVSYLLEKFNDGSRTNLLPPGSAAWFASSSSGVHFTNGTGGANGSLALDNGSSRTLIGYFTAPGSSVMLQPGDRVTLDITFAVNGVPPSRSNGLIVGLLQSAANPAAVSGTGFTAPGARVSGDFGSSNPTSHVFGSYTGYAAWTNLGGGTNPVTIRRRIVTAPPGTDGLNNASATWNQIGSASGSGTAPVPNVDFRAVLTLTRTLSGSMELGYTLLQNGSTLVSYTTVEPVASYVAFDTVNVYMASDTVTGGSAARLALKQVSVTHTPPAAVAPTIAAQPESRSATVGETLSFAVTANGTDPLGYQWLRNGEAIPGANASTLTLANVTTAAAGAYSVVVSNGAGSATSDAATLTVAKAAAEIALSELTAVYDGTPKAVVATTTPAGLAVAVTYDGSALPPANSGSYAVTATIVDADYRGEASATLTIAPAPAVVALGGLSRTYNGSAQPVSVTTTPAGLNVSVTYDGGSSAPTNAGSYAVTATVVEPNYTGAASGTLTIAPATATIALHDLVQAYDGTPRVVTATTVPAGLDVILTYDGATAPPTAPGTYAVDAVIDSANHQGTASATLVVTTTVQVRHAPTLNGAIDGSVHVLLAENVTLNGSAWVSGDLLVPGTPAVLLNGNPTYAGTIDGAGASHPANHRIVLNGSAVLRHVVRRTDALMLPTVSAPLMPAGTRSVTLNGPGASPGDFATVRHLTLNGAAGDVAVPPGVYGDFTANGQASLVLGVAGATEPAVYHLQRLTLNGNAGLRIVGPVILTLAHGGAIQGTVGETGHPEWLELRVHAGGLTLDSNATLSGRVVAPNGTVTVNGNSTLQGSVAADRLIVNGNGLIRHAAP